MIKFDTQSEFLTAYFDGDGFSGYIDREGLITFEVDGCGYCCDKEIDLTIQELEEIIQKAKEFCGRIQ